MGESNYLVQIVHKKSGTVVQWEPGLAIEKQFETELVDRVLEKCEAANWGLTSETLLKKVSTWKRAQPVALTTSSPAALRAIIAKAIRAAFDELFYELKSRV